MAPPPTIPQLVVRCEHHPTYAGVGPVVRRGAEDCAGCLAVQEMRGQTLSARGTKRGNGDPNTLRVIYDYAVRWGSW